MNQESSPRDGMYAKESTEELLKEIRQTLSPNWPKSIQELLPGYLPDLSFSELSIEEQELYQRAYHLLGDLVRQEIADVAFTPEEHVDSALVHEAVARPRFTLHVDHGSTRKTEEDDMIGESAFDHA